jgi:hypothetical protein
MVMGFMESESERGKKDAKIEGSYQKYSNFSKRFDEVHKTLGCRPESIFSNLGRPTNPEKKDKMT